MNSLTHYKIKVIEVERTRLRLQQLEGELREIELKLGELPENAIVDVVTPERLKPLVHVFKKNGRRLTLNDATKHMKLTRTGVWNQLRKLIDLGQVRQIDRGLYELVER